MHDILPAAVLAVRLPVGRILGWGWRMTDSKRAATATNMLASQDTLPGLSLRTPRDVL